MLCRPSNRLRYPGIDGQALDGGYPGEAATPGLKLKLHQGLLLAGQVRFARDAERVVHHQWLAGLPTAVRVTNIRVLAHGREAEDD